jgi:hypothetical protein
MLLHHSARNGKSGLGVMLCKSPTFMGFAWCCRSQKAPVRGGRRGFLVQRDHESGELVIRGSVVDALSFHQGE